MTAPRSSPPARWIRSAAVLAMAGALVLGLQQGWITPPHRSTRGRWAHLHRNAGDTYVRIVYLASPRPGTGRGRGGRFRLLRAAERHYALSMKAHASDPHTLASLGLVLVALGDGQQGRQMIARAALHSRLEAERRALAATLEILSDTPSLERMTLASGLFSRLAPGPLASALWLDRLGRGDLAEAQWQQAQEQAGRLALRLVALVAIAGLLVLAGLAGIIVLCVTRKLGTPEPISAAPWSVPEATESLVVWVFLATALAGLLARHEARRDGTLSSEVLAVVPGLISAGGALAWAWFFSGRPRPSCDWRRIGHNIGRGVAAAGILVPAVLALAWVLGRVWGPVEHPLAPALVMASSGAERAALLLATCLAAPALEEALFRGVLYRALRRSWSAWPSAGASGLVFAAGHMSWVGLLPYLLFGVALAFLYERTKFLAAPAAAHSLYNVLNVAVIMALFGDASWPTNW